MSWMQKEERKGTAVDTTLCSIETFCSEVLVPFVTVAIFVPGIQLEPRGTNEHTVNRMQ